MIVSSRLQGRCNRLSLRVHQHRSRMLLHSLKCTSQQASAILSMASMTLTSVPDCQNMLGHNHRMLLKCGKTALLWSHSAPCPPALPLHTAALLDLTAWNPHLFYLSLSACRATLSCCCHPNCLFEPPQPAPFKANGRLLTRALARDRTKEDLLKVLRSDATLTADFICYTVEKACADLRSKRRAPVNTGFCGRLESAADKSVNEQGLIKTRVTMVVCGYIC